jgi:hypothetical protein
VKFLTVLVAAGGGLALAGCYGSTEKATDVGFTSATLHGHGVTNNGPATSFFEYWPTATPAQKQTTQNRDWPANISGNFSEQVSGLSQGTKYQFRLCGHDSGQPSICAQTRNFETPAPDRVVGTATSGDLTWTLDASSGPSGENPHGTFQGYQPSTQSGFTGSIGCLAVHGDTARFYAVGVAVVGGTVHSAWRYGVVSASSLRVESGDPNPPADCVGDGSGDFVYNGSFTLTDSAPPAPPD